MNIETLGIDIGKSTFHAVGLDASGQPVYRHRHTRVGLTRFLATLPPCRIGMEACAGPRYWERVLSAQGHTVKLMAAQFVKPYVKSNKSDFLDAAAIAEAVSRPTMRFVAPKTPVQQDLQALHRMRSLLVGQRTAQINQLRAFLLEDGITIPQGVSAFRLGVPAILADAANGLSPRMREMMTDLWRRIQELDGRIGAQTGAIVSWAENDPACQRLLTVPGIGPLTATALVAAVGHGEAFRRGRELAAFLGLVPRQHATGGKPRLLGISKRGNSYVRCLLIHGARAVLRGADRRTDRLGPGAPGTNPPECRDRGAREQAGPYRLGGPRHRAGLRAAPHRTGGLIESRCFSTG